jgi:hypothetical protein
MSRGGRWVGDEAGFVVRTVAVTLLVLAVVGVAALDGISILSARYRVADAADHAAEETAYTYKQSRDVRAACDDAVQTVAASDSSARIPRGGCVIDPRTGAVTITVRQTASTIVAKRISALEKYTKAEATSTAPPPP